ncbi:carboxylesterase [Holotrichia oblita]|uniref:Carboxylesterase n=1 Tax=Holotrichia oblita TaxID=644536 RepID=A0ACB9TQB1_HOLOL|nr:carboxylesterase [Holotrichia oblita]
MADPIVEIQQGKLRGRVDSDYRGVTFYSFQGIPYAKPPLGKLRFKAPQPPEAWSGIRDATKEGSECYSMHMLLNTIVGSEDCLFLNVYTPELPSHENHPLKPVMVWIHGGGYTSGSGNSDLYGPHYLIAEDVVVVTINYRLGVLGFLCLDDPKLGVPGNAGLKDQVMALKWVQENIKHFGGDPNNVTIFGESAGASSVHFLVVSPMAKGLFHKAIAQSGCCFNTWAWGNVNGKILCDKLQYSTDDESEMLEFLREVPVDKLYSTHLIPADVMRVDLRRPLGPVIEKISPYEPAFLAEDPMDIILQGKHQKVPFLLGYLSREGMLIDVIVPKDRQLITDFEEAIPFNLGIPKGTPLSLKTAEKIKQFYYSDKQPSLDDKDTLYKLQTDNFFFREIYITAKQHASTSSEPVYFYKFCIDGPLNMFKKLLGIDAPGACHADELSYLFKTSIVGGFDPNSYEGKNVLRMIRWWTNFAKYGDPNPRELDNIIDVYWEPIRDNKMNYMEIDYQLKTGEDPDGDRMRFWDEIYSQSIATSNL